MVLVRELGYLLCHCLGVTIPPVEQVDAIGGAVTRDDLAVWDDEFRGVCSRLGRLFSRPEPRAHAEHYLRGLLAPLERKNGWTIAEYSGEREPKALQRFLNLTPWDADALRDLVRVYAMEYFADRDAVLIADPTGFAKKGKKSAGVQRQYSGTLGRVDNCQIGTFLAYVNSAGDWLGIVCWWTGNCMCPNAHGSVIRIGVLRPGSPPAPRSPPVRSRSPP